MNRLFYFTIIVIAIEIISGCANSSTLAKNSVDKKVEADSISSLIESSNLDGAADAYVELKSLDNNQATKKAASALAVAHMAKKEYILANFYLQEALSIDPSDEFLKFLLVKNQFLSANLHSRDQSYIKKALKALEANRYLVADSDLQILSNTMLTRVKIDMAWNNKEVGNLYKKMNKQDASKLYMQKIENLGYNIYEVTKY